MSDPNYDQHFVRKISSTITSHLVDDPESTFHCLELTAKSRRFLFIRDNDEIDTVGTIRFFFQDFDIDMIDALIEDLQSARDLMLIRRSNLLVSK